MTPEASRFLSEVREIPDAEHDDPRYLKAENEFLRMAIDRLQHGLETLPRAYHADAWGKELTEWYPETLRRVVLENERLKRQIRKNAK